MCFCVPGWPCIYKHHEPVIVSIFGLVQGSPNLVNQGKETYRHGLAVTAMRPGRNDGVPYLYTLNLAAPQDAWDYLEPMFRKVSKQVML